MEKRIPAMNQVLPAAYRQSFSFFCICVVSGLLEGRKTKIPEWSFCSSEIGYSVLKQNNRRFLHSKLSLCFFFFFDRTGGAGAPTGFY
jgi:hypothetical protein